MKQEMEVIAIQKSALDGLNKELRELLEMTKNATQKYTSIFKEEKWIDNQEVCMIMNITKQTLQTYKEKGLLPYSKLNRNNYYKLSDVHALLEAGQPYNTNIFSKSNTTSWTFTTIYDPLYLKHPVSGNRDFGIRPGSNGSLVFYTRGVDRMTTWDVATFQYLHDNLLGNIPGPYSKGDQLWSSFQCKLTDFINSNGGSAGVGNPEILRPDWGRVKEVLEGRQPVQILDKNCN